MQSNLRTLLARMRLIGGVSAAAVVISLGCPSKSIAGDLIQWDQQASNELAASLHHMHHVWDAGDIAAIKRLLIGDDVLVSFELNPSDHTPIRLNSKHEIDQFIDNVLQVVNAQGAKTDFGRPKVNCRATQTFGVCTEECTIHFAFPNGSARTDKLWSTAVAVKIDGEWRWIQWQMAVAAQ